MVRREIKIFRNADELAEEFALEFVKIVRDASGKCTSLNVALSGGNTPRLYFSVIAEKYSEYVNWNHVHFFWVDERCVAPEDPDSNYGMARDLLLSKLIIPGKNIHRIRGEDDPGKEALRYSDDIKFFTRSVNLSPSFDVMILGMGDDGHTASVFPGSLDSFRSEKIYDVAVHPVSGQKRITVTGKVINNSSLIFFVVAGESKARVIEAIFREKAEALQYPAAYVNPASGNVKWMLDSGAAGLIS